MRLATSLIALLALVACTGGPGGSGDTSAGGDTAAGQNDTGVVDTAVTDTGHGDTGVTSSGGDTGTASSGGDTGTGHNACNTIDAVVTDIDATLTTQNSEWWAQIVSSTYDAAMRPDANTLMQDYAAKGYAIFYITARGTDTPMTDDRDAQTVTEDWLTAHNFPDVQTSHVILASGIGVYGNSAETFKAQVIEGLQSQGYTFDWGYGNATSDIAAYQDAGMADSGLFMVGDLAGTDGVTGITNADAYTNHLSFLSQVPNASCPE